VSRYQAGLIIIAFLFGSCATEAASPNTGMQAACAGDRQRLCSAFVGKPSDMQKCMSAHRGEFSDGCKAVTSGGPKAAASDGSTKAEPTRAELMRMSKERRQAYCKTYVRNRRLALGLYVKGNNGVDARPEVARCMQGELTD